MSDAPVYVPRVIEYNDNQPLGVDGVVVGVLHSSQSSRRITVLVEEPAERHRDDEDVAEEPEAVDDLTCVGKDGECSRTVDEEGDRCWQHPEEDDND